MAANDNVIDLDSQRPQALAQRRMARRIGGLGWPIATGSLLAVWGYGYLPALGLAVAVPFIYDRAQAAGSVPGRPLPIEQAVINGVAMLGTYSLIKPKLKRRYLWR